MPASQSSPNPIQPLSVGNVVSAGFRLYRSHLKLYLGLAFQAYLWRLVPIYGWAKYSAISAMISRLSFSELINQPETVSMASPKIYPRMWSFFTLSLQIGFSLLLVSWGLYNAWVLIDLIAAFILGLIFAQFPQATAAISIFRVLLLAGILIVGFTWFFSHWMVAEVALAVEEEINPTQSMERSWSLTKNSAVRIQIIAIVAFAVTLPLIFLINYLHSIILVGIDENTPLSWTVHSISLLTSLAGGALVMPLWQSIKAVIYCDLRSRREGLGLQLRDRTI
jgi:hypothetical protein